MKRVDCKKVTALWMGPFCPGPPPCALGVQDSPQEGGDVFFGSAMLHSMKGCGGGAIPPMAHGQSVSLGQGGAIPKGF